MKTAEEILYTEVTDKDVKYIESSSFLPDRILDAMRIYAKQVAEQALIKAAQRLHISYISQELNPEEETQIIVSTPIVTP